MTPEDLRQAIIAAKDTLAVQQDRGDPYNEVAFSANGFTFTRTALTFQQLALLVEAAEGVA